MSTLAAPVTSLLHVDRLRHSPANPRRAGEVTGLDELADSIRAQGIIQPLLVRPVGEDGDAEIVAGHRRYEAAKLAGLTTVPVIIEDY